VDKTDVEILWTLKKFSSQVLNHKDLMAKNSRISMDEKTKQKLRFLVDDEYVKSSVIQGRGFYFLLKSKGNDLIWKGDLGLQIIRLLYYAKKVSSADLERYLDSDKEIIHNEIGDLRNSRKLIRRKDELDDEKYWVLTDDKGKDFARNLCEGLDVSIQPTRLKNPVELLEKYFLPGQLSGYNLEPVRNSVFVIMPMGDDYPEHNEIFKIMKLECKKLGLDAKRVDEIPGSTPINEDALTQIVMSEFLIVDLTEARPNVYYELGYAHGTGITGKSILQIARDGTKPHFDIIVSRVKFYKKISDINEIILKEMKKIMDLRDNRSS
jgi:hypothetical protein